MKISPKGMGVKTVSSIWVLNPTGQKHSWKLFNSNDTKDYQSRAFRCLNPRGHLGSGNKQLLKFEFTADTTESIFSTWKLCSQTLQVEVTIFIEKALFKKKYFYGQKCTVIQQLYVSFF